MLFRLLSKSQTCAQLYTRHPPLGPNSSKGMEDPILSSKVQFRACEDLLFFCLHYSFSEWMVKCIKYVLQVHNKVVSLRNGVEGCLHSVSRMCSSNFGYLFS